MHYLKEQNKLLSNYINDSLWNACSLFDQIEGLGVENKKLDRMTDSLCVDIELLQAKNRGILENCKRAYELITKCDDAKTPEGKCKSWNEGFDILRNIIKDDE